MGEVTEMGQGRSSNTALTKDKRKYARVASNLDWLTISVRPSGDVSGDTQAAIFNLHKALCDVVPVGEEMASLYSFRGQQLIASHSISVGGHSTIRLHAKDWASFSLRASRDGEVHLSGTVYSACLWSGDVFDMHAWLDGEIHEWLRSYMPVGVAPSFVLDCGSRNDFTAHVAGFDLASQMRGVRAYDRFVTRAKYVQPLHKDGDVETVYFGKRSDDGIMLRLYDKLGKAQKDGSLDRWCSLWLANGYDGSAAVTCIEFEVTGSHMGQLLGACGVTFEDVQRDGSLLHMALHVQDIWAYLTHNWIRHTIPNFKDTRRSRWRVSQFWTCVSDDWDTTLTVDLPSHLQRLTTVEAPKLLAQSAGCSVGMLARLPGTHTLTDDEILAAVHAQHEKAMLRQARQAGCASLGDWIYRRKLRIGLSA